MTGDADVGGISKVCPDVELITCGPLKAMGFTSIQQLDYQSRDTGARQPQ